MTISPLSGLSQPNGITGTLTGLSNAGGLSSQASAGPAPTYATWSPTDKNASLTVSNGDLTVSKNTTSWAAIRATGFVGAGQKRYFETTCPSSTTGLLIGVGNASASLASNAFVGSDSNAIGYFGAAQTYFGGAGTSYGIVFPAGSVIGCAINTVAGEIQWFVNGSGQGIIAIPAITGDLYPMISLEGSAQNTTTNFGSSAWAYAPPTGFTGVTV